MTFYFYPYPPFKNFMKILWNFLVSHLVSTTCKLTSFQMQLESVLSSLYQKQEMDIVQIVFAISLEKLHTIR